MCLNCNLYLWWDSISLLIFFSLDVVCNNNDFPYFVYALRLRRQSLIKVNIIVFICFIAKIFSVAFRSHHNFLVTSRKRIFLGLVYRVQKILYVRQKTRTIIKYVCADLGLVAPANSRQCLNHASQIYALLAYSWHT